MRKAARKETISWYFSTVGVNQLLEYVTVTMTLKYNLRHGCFYTTVPGLDTKKLTRDCHEEVSIYKKPERLIFVGVFLSCGFLL